MNLLSTSERAGEGGKKRGQENQGTQRGESSRTGMKIYPAHAINESNCIA
jgi:hypothetical protein